MGAAGPGRPGRPGGAAGGRDHPRTLPGHGGPHTLYLGDRQASPPAYDLAAVLRRTPEAPTGRAALGPLLPSPRFAVPRTDAPVSERYRGPIAAALLLVLAGRATLAGRLTSWPRGEPPRGA